MPKLVYLVELDPVSIAQLQSAGALIQGMLDNIQIVQLPDVEEGEIDFHAGADEVPAERTPDPAFTPPVPAPPMNHQDDFGAGPPPG